MKKIFKIIIVFVLVIGTLMTSTFSAFAEKAEKYLCELRLVYAEDYREAQDILGNSEFYEYELYKKNLNEGTGEIGVFLAYKTTTNIEDAITDIATIEMDGGYREGNYQETLKQSYEEYVALGENYVVAINYFMDAYEANNFIAKAAFRQLNFYTVIDEEVTFNGMLLGDIFKAGITAPELATMFLEGNVYALDNIRSLISMGVTYNADGKTYLEKVSEEAALFAENPSRYADKVSFLNNAAVHVKAAMKVYYDMFKELSGYEKLLNYEDEDFTELEIQYAEHKAIADMMRKVDYLDGKTLYDFCLAEGGDLKVENERLYPLIAALNEGQRAMTLVGHYYDVVRYSMKDFPEKMITEQIDDLEVIYSINPFDIYKGVDRSIYDGSFAMTGEAYRRNAFTEEGLMAYLFNMDNVLFTSLAIAGGAIGLGLSVWALVRTYHQVEAAMAIERANKVATDVATYYVEQSFQIAEDIMAKTLVDPSLSITHKDLIDELMFNYYPDIADQATLPFTTKVSLLEAKFKVAMRPDDQLLFQDTLNQFDAVQTDIVTNGHAQLQNAKDMTVNAMNNLGTFGTGVLYVVGGALMLFSALTLAIQIDNYYYPMYSDIPVAMVDFIDTDYGDHYVKYDAVYNARDYYGEYLPGDLNAFGGQRWNALYYTKSYEAGSPLLADFELNNENNVPDEGYAPVHRFGEVVCYDLNKYNFEADSDNIYLSVLRSENQKSAVADVPEVVGSIFSNGWIFVAGGVGLVAGIGMTLGVQAVGKKRKKSNLDKKPAE